MSKLVKMRQIWISKDKTLCYEEILVNKEQIVCIEPNAIRTTSYPSIVDYLNVDRSKYEKTIDEIQCLLITLTSGKEITVTDKFKDIERILGE